MISIKNVTSNNKIIKKSSKLTKNKNRIGYLFILPFLIGLFFIFIPALIDSVVYSFSKVTINFDNVVKEYIGFENFYNALQVDIKFRVLILDATRGMLLDLLVIIIFSFFIANVLNQKFKGRGITRTIFFLPVLLATGIIAAADTNNLAMSIFNSASNTDSTISNAFVNNGFSVLFNLEDLLLSTNISPTVTKVILSTVNNTYNIVNSSGVQILIFLSALQSISPSIFESAKVEGATKWEEFWKITFPMLTPMILVNIIYTIVDTFTNPKYQILQYIQTVAFSNDQLGLASSLSWIYFIIVLTFLGVICGLILKRIQYLD